ncbi:hypothetical protein RAA17_25585 [Komagataeibacter rhaeticus]|nr:hypothetical protein [Komagataeibacter rhaeticus]
MLQELVAQDARKQLWPGPSARDRVERCRGWMMFSQSRQVNFSRIV